MSSNSYCPICKTQINGHKRVHTHLVEEHNFSKRQATFFTKKQREWRDRQEEIVTSLKQMATQKGIKLTLR